MQTISIVAGGLEGRVEIELGELRSMMPLAIEHTVGGLLAETVMNGSVSITDIITDRTEKRRVLMQFAEMQMQHRAQKLHFDKVLSEFTSLLKGKNIDFVVFKGPAVASWYASPWCRTMGDIDFFVPEWDYERALSLIQQKLKLTVERCDADKHDSFSYRGIRFEMHYQMETFGAGKHQRYFSALVDKEIKDGRLGHFCISTGVQVPMLSPEVDLILVFKHMFNHLIGEGVGLRQVTDVAVLIRAYAPTLNISALKEHLQNIGYLKAFDVMVLFLQIMIFNYCNLQI